MATINTSSKARADIKGVLEYTLKKWGEAKYWQYRDLIEEAFNDILADPQCGRVLCGQRPNVLGHPIGKRGRRARHIILYRVGRGGHIDIVRFLYDGMDFERYLR